MLATARTAVSCSCFFFSVPTYNVLLLFAPARATSLSRARSAHDTKAEHDDIGSVSTRRVVHPCGNDIYVCPSLEYAYEDLDDDDDDDDDDDARVLFNRDGLFFRRWWRRRH